MAAAKSDKADGPKCPICLDVFKIPRELPCAHCFCQSCLQSYIITESTKQPELKEIDCPVCRQPASSSKTCKTVQEWASLFPLNMVLQAISTAKSKLDWICEACNSEGVSVTAEGFCVVCKEAVCGNCITFHRKQKLLKNHTILAMENVCGNLQNVIRYAQLFTCSEHDEEIKFYCNDHKVACCGSCSFLCHKTCSKVVQLRTELPRLLQEDDSNEIIEKMMNVERHLKQFIGMNASSIRELESEVHAFSNQIRELRRKINAALDDLENRVKIEGHRIYIKEMNVKKEENHQCLSLLHAVKNSCINLETVNKFGTDVQKFLTAERMRSQLGTYYNQIRSKYEMIDSTSVKMKLSSQVESILSVPSSDYGKLVSSKSSKKVFMQEAHLQNIKLSEGAAWITGVTSLPGDRLILTEYYGGKCILLNASYNIITSYAVKGKCFDICVAGDDEVAVSMMMDSNIQILSVRNDVISPVRTIHTRYICTGVCAVGDGHIAITGNCDLKTCFWGLISRRGEEKFLHQFESGHGNCYIAVNESKTKVYVTVPTSDSLHCFDISGMILFVYRSVDLQGPSGVAVDKDGNVFVLGNNSCNIHRLSTEGSVLDIFPTIDPNPNAICYITDKDSFIVTHYSGFKLCILRTK